MDLKELITTLESVKNSKTDPLSEIDSRIAEAQKNLDVLREIRKLLDPNPVVKKTWSRKKKTADPDSVQSTHKTFPIEHADSGNKSVNPIAQKIAHHIYSTGPQKVSDIILTKIASEPTIRNYLRAPFFMQGNDMQWSLTSLGKTHYLPSIAAND